MRELSVAGIAVVSSTSSSCVYVGTVPLITTSVLNSNSISAEAKG